MKWYPGEAVDVCIGAREPPCDDRSRSRELLTSPAYDRKRVSFRSLLSPRSAALEGCKKARFPGADPALSDCAPRGLRTGSSKGHFRQVYA